MNGKELWGTENEEGIKIFQPCILPLENSYRLEEHEHGSGLRGGGGGTSTGKEQLQAAMLSLKTIIKRGFGSSPAAKFLY